MANNRRDDLPMFRWYMARIRYRGRNPNRGRRKTSDLTVDDLVEQWERQQGICPHTGWKLRLPDSTVGWKGGLKSDCGSLDRSDSSQGYVKGNVVFAVMENFAKNAFSDADVLAFCRAVAARAGG